MRTKYSTCSVCSKFESLRIFVARAVLFTCVLSSVESLLPPTVLTGGSQSVHRQLCVKFGQAIDKEDTEWRDILSPEEYYILREEGTEPPFSSELNSVKESGTFVCRGCGAPLFTTGSKFDSGTGWPSFTYPVDDSVDLRTDFKLIIPRTECRCATCKGHLGHVFSDGPEPTGLRYCMNGLAMSFKSDDEHPETAKLVNSREVIEGRKSVRPPLGVALPGIVLNSFLAVAITSSFFSGPHGQASSVLEYFPLVFAFYFGWLVVRDISRFMS
uniref:Peptide-methionine (R)-S-oxide reductase n=1 Tax=Odontella aurita TaxID=265563 RepID=A0A7S4K071_9STRA|mmetsp:Transcript_58422/g.174045  ORF Transcript_58422/g.174045 Transcript_58422/m.174045 type:complete len:271 (+) Transcript_58422:115-927(+)